MRDGVKPYLKVCGAGVLGMLVTMLGAVPALAFPSTAPLWGPTGLGSVPTADVVPEKVTEIGVGYERIRPDGLLVGSSVRFFPTLTANHGLHRAEVGVGLLREDVNSSFFDFSNSYKAAHGKYRVYQHDSKDRAVAVGAHYLDFGSIPGDVLSLYAVASEGFLEDPGARGIEASRGRAHLGVMHNRIDGAVSGNDTRLFGGVELIWRRGLSAFADYTAKSGQSVRLWNVGARYQQNRYGVQAGYGQLRGSDSKYFVSFSYRFGAGS
jgi:hypothetical protein